jgi:RNA polymerase sigma-70 factor (ECF subfamily)
MADRDPLNDSFDDPPSAAGTLPLARQAQSGDALAMTALFERFQEPLRRIVRIRMGAQLRHSSGLESLDVIQQTFMKAWCKLDEFELRSERSVLCWLARIAERQILDEADKLRASKRAASTTVSIETLFGVGPERSSRFDPTSSGSTPDGHAQREELKQIIDEAVQELEENHREVILLRNYSDADWDEVARHIGAPNVRAAQAMHYRARARLASILAQKLPREFRAES